jgi:hypothetical protein
MWLIVFFFFFSLFPYLSTIKKKRNFCASTVISLDIWLEIVLNRKLKKEEKKNSSSFDFSHKYKYYNALLLANIKEIIIVKIEEVVQEDVQKMEIEIIPLNEKIIVVVVALVDVDLVVVDLVRVLILVLVLHHVIIRR